MTPQEKNLLKISELARLAQVSPPTIKHYVHQGLLPKPVKTGRTMAYYDASCVERIKFIKKMQREKFLPLEVIKRMIEGGRPDEDEMELGQAIFRIDPKARGARAVAASQLERRTGFPAAKIRLLEEHGLLNPERRNGDKFYDASDLKVIELMKQREALGIPLDYSLRLLDIYREAMARAVDGDIRLFARSFLGDIPAKQMVKLITEADPQLDHFMALMRRRMIKAEGKKAVEQLDRLGQMLPLMLPPPVSDRDLPEQPPDDARLRLAWFLFRGQFQDAEKLLLAKPRELRQYALMAHAVLALLTGEFQQARARMEKDLQKPGPRPLDNAAAALILAAEAGRATGFSVPIFLAKRLLAYLRRIEAAEGEGPELFIARYVCGCLYIMLPDILDVTAAGERMLDDFERRARKRQSPGKLPDWLWRVLKNELLAELETRANRFLAEAALRRGDRAEARRRTARVLELSDPEGEHAVWARYLELELGENPPVTAGRGKP